MDDKMMKHGAFSWFELMTTDIAAAREFYSKLLNWKMRDNPMEHINYTVISANEEEVAGIMDMPPDAKNMPPSWGVYVTVNDIADTVKVARELGGNILIEPRDIPGVGQFCVIQDPQGAWFSAIEYKKE
ncbi:MAG: VOC family protein [Calditrichaceae bacterium]|nr:VOC family protein [Calditrichaceae bacterium]